MCMRRSSYKSPLSVRGRKGARKGESADTSHQTMHHQHGSLVNVVSRSLPREHRSPPPFFRGREFYKVAPQGPKIPQTCLAFWAGKKPACQGGHAGRAFLEVEAPKGILNHFWFQAAGLLLRSPHRIGSETATNLKRSRLTPTAIPQRTRDASARSGVAVMQRL